MQMQTNSQHLRNYANQQNNRKNDYQRQINILTREKQWLQA